MLNREITWQVTLFYKWLVDSIKLLFAFQVAICRRHHLEHHPSDFRSIESSLESSFMAPLRALRQKLLGPFALLLAQLGVTADMISFAALIPALGFCLLAPSHFTLALCLMAISLF